ncbi:pentatricopeptide repeat-containing protein At3g16610-like [Zingiber officinale]|uniref:pentatricopeptide repeat-containing protein At3g16610-like n=1 Tax=Zingiber officinale TaxID=94328 RepID=UPI001C4D8248|nr:pentatricopeptide repeat-containing protein At3g16610-like [Zingiber officinale]
MRISLLDFANYLHQNSAFLHSFQIARRRQRDPSPDHQSQMYISCGEIESARLAFDELLQPSVFLWNAMIRAYAWNGPFGHAVELYQRMLDIGIEPNKFTFPFVLKACSALEALADGILIHEHAKKVGLELDVFVSTALLDMYLKCGCLEDAHEVLCKMPQKDVAWNA